MKKFWKVTLLTGIVCIMAGLILSAILTFGFSEEVLEHANEFSINENNFLEYFQDGKYVSIDREGKHHDEYETNASYYFSVPDKNTVTGIDFEIAVGEVKIKNGDTMEISVTDMFENAISSYVEDGIWYITDSLIGSDSVHSEYCPKITITIPKDFTADVMEIYLAAGVMEADNLVADDMKLKVEAGGMKIFYLKAADSLAVKNGVGEVKIYDAKINNLSIDEGVGAISVTGKITGHNTIKGGIGEVKLTLTDRSQVDFNYKVTCGIGEVEIGDMRFGGNASATNKEHQDADYFEIDCGIGHIDIDVNGYY